MRKKVVPAGWPQAGESYGRTRQGKPRWSCPNCRRTFVGKNAAHRPHRPQPPPRSGECATARHRIVDGTRIEGRNGVGAVLDAARSAGVYAAPEMTEGPAHLTPFCTPVAAHGCAPIRAPLDGNPHLIRIVRRLGPTLVIQCWLVHSQRQGLSWCRRPPNVEMPTTGAPCFTQSGRSTRRLTASPSSLRSRPGNAGMGTAWRRLPNPGGRQRSQARPESVARRVAEHGSVS